MAATGETTIDFGTGADQVTVAVARSQVIAGSHVEAYLFPKATSNHSVDEQMVDPPIVLAHDVVAGVGFSITALTPPGKRSLRPEPDPLAGVYNIRWVSTD